MTKSKKPFITRNELLRLYPGITTAMIKKYLPKPVIGLNPKAPRMLVWPRKETLQVIRDNKVLRNAVEQHRVRAEREKLRRANLFSFVSSFTPAHLIEKARTLDRRFILHIGPTNSGKTYQALEALKKAGTGVYLGPLRLLALEVSDKLNAAGCPCNLLTGEESVPVEGARLTASTIEMCDFREQYDVAVIDEAQMITDPSRGAHWLNAISCVNAAEVHVCLAREGEDLVRSYIDSFGCPVEVCYHERLTPLVLGKPVNGYEDIRTGDAVIAFSRKAVLGIAGSLEKRGLKASVIYGSLPPDVRREEVRKYASHETSVVVATDAIGMGISLPIKRIVFTTLEKYDGINHRMLTDSEILQIAGRAGRYGIYNIGEVTSTCERKYLRRALNGVPVLEAKMRVAFPKEAALNSEFTFSELFNAWQELPRSEAYAREDMSDALILLAAAAKKKLYLTREELLTAITCPVDTGNNELVRYWVRCVEAIDRGQPLPLPKFGTDTLEKCELQYHALDTYHLMTHRFEQPDLSGEIRRETGEKINQLLQQSKENRTKTCSVCGKELPLDSTFNICGECARRARGG